MMKDSLSRQESPDIVDKTAETVELTQKITPEQRRLYAQRYQRATGKEQSQHAKYDLSVVIPTRNEADNIIPLLREVSAALDGIRAEIIFVDDSDDNTPGIVRDASVSMVSSYFHVHLEHRRKGSARAGGLATAVDRGLRIAQAKYVAVLDADLQHPPAQLKIFYEQAVLHDVDMVLASRYIKGGSYGGLDGISRLFFSVGLKTIAKIAFPEQLLRVSDPLGGFFMLRRSLLTGVVLRPIGYKILLEILIRCQWQDLIEVPYAFQARAHGQSKADVSQGVRVFQHIGRLLREVPAAGRIWKISVLMLINIMAVATLFFLYPYVTTIWNPLSTGVFVVFALANFLIFNRVIFPAHATKNQPVFAPLVPVDLALTVSLPSISGPLLSDIAQTQTTRLPKAPQADMAQAQTMKVPMTPLPDMALDLLQTVESQATALPEASLDLLQTVESQATALPEASLDLLQTVKGQAASPDMQQMVRHPVTPLPVTSSGLLPTRQIVKKLPVKDRMLGIIAVLLVIATLIWIGYLALGWTSYALPSAWVIFAALFFGFGITIITSHKQVDFHQVITMLLAIAVAISFVDYLSWRFEVTNWIGWWIAVPLLVAETLGALHTLGLQFTLWPRSQPRLQRSEDPTRYPIFIFIPTVGEGVSILEPTLKGILRARDRYHAKYPNGQVSVVVCNDGFVAKTTDWQETEELARRMGVQCVTRRIPGGAKAGNIENARQQVGATDDALIVIFDADQVAKDDFLLKTIPSFADPNIGWVQTGQYYRNLDNPVTLWADDQQAMFYNLLCPGKAAWNAAFICGTNVIIRARALDEIGGLPQDSVTEDFAASIALHTRWKSVYLTDVLATGLGPMDMSSYLKQQRRWAIGTLGVMRSHWQDILLPKKNGLSIGQRIQYFLACTHYLCGLRDLIYLICPILFIFTGVPAVHGSTLDAFLWHFLPYLLASAATIWYAGRGITGLRGIILGFGCFPVLLESLVAVIFKRKVGFSVTSKKRGAKGSNRYLWPYIFFVIACISAIGYALQEKVTQQVSLIISLMWVTYSLLMLCSFLWLCFRDGQVRIAETQVAATSIKIETYEYPSKLKNRSQGLRSIWNIGFALLLAALVFTAGTFHSDGVQAAPFVVGINSTNRAYLGVSLPIQLLKQRPALLEQKLGAQLSIVGRTQDVVKDQFDRPWADSLAAQNERPWITLQFGSFLANGKPPTDASLLAIANGLHDDALQHWAQDIRAYGKPVYLTILLHVDRNWSLSSAVANGGIPQDAPLAWMHVQSIFKQIGANNVAWVWSPADPVHDQAYAPPISTIDLVLISMISYPKTQWADPQITINALIKRYPTKPIMLEVSASGTSDQKAAWLAKVGNTVEKTHNVYALMYHDGSPGTTSTSADNDGWSMLSDPASLNTMRQIAAYLDRK